MKKKVFTKSDQNIYLDAPNCTLFKFSLKNALERINYNMFSKNCRGAKQLIAIFEIMCIAMTMIYIK